ncbi:MAG TPA: molybdenum cofactor guanylyltransferase [Gemmatimonadaceae bacterium]|nr:molybdenum cofactor guanylyltransferase [Gemmatimonadaceae bacterium]
MRLPCTGVVLAGGAASRFGGVAKGLERVAGERIIDRVAGALREVADDLLLIANDPRADSWLPGVRLARDVHAGQGSLGGLHAALHHAQRAVLVAAWDMPFVPGALLGRLRQLGDDADAAVPESGSRRGLEPLCAWYGPRCLAAIERTLAADDRRVIGFFDAVRLARLPASEVSAFGDPEWMFMNVNTPEDLARAEAYAAAAPGGHHRTQE